MTAVTELSHGTPGVALREGRAPVAERLTAMLFLAALLHAIVILGLTFASTGHGGSADSPQLDVLLVTNEVPEAQSNDQAIYLAQRTQLGSGNTDLPQPAASPASRGAPDPRPDAGRGSGNAGGASQVDNPVLASSAPSSDIRYFGEAAPAAPAEAMPEFIGDTPGEPRSGHGDAVELLLRGKSNGEHWVTPDTRASTLAPYLAAWKRKVERVGNLNLPSAVRHAGLSGSPVVEVEISASGRLQHASVRRSSGHGALDQAALTILKLASPFEPFPAELASGYAQLRFAYQWDFVAGSLQSGAVTVSSDTRSGP
ncbi:MAG: energy transducer TonB [Steroidobacterales bacterium]